MTEPADTLRPRRLGRGLDALLGGPLPALAPSATPIAGGPPATPAPGSPTPTDPDAPALLELDPRQIRPNPEQPRHHFDPEALHHLAESIRIHGVLHPIVVERVPGGGYQLVAGERRWRASQQAEMATIPAIVRPAAESARQALELALTENLVRADLSPLEEAAAYSRLADTFGLTHEAIALRVGRSRPQVSNTIRLLQLPAAVQEAVAESRLSAGHARALLALPDEAAQETLAARIEARNLSVREAERAVAGWHTADRPLPPVTATGPSPADVALIRGFETVLGLPVQISRSTKGGGRVIVDFTDDNDLDGLYSRIGGAPL